MLLAHRRNAGPSQRRTSRSRLGAAHVMLAIALLLGVGVACEDGDDAPLPADAPTLPAAPGTSEGGGDGESITLPQGTRLDAAFIAMVDVDDIDGDVMLVEQSGATLLFATFRGADENVHSGNLYSGTCDSLGELAIALGTVSPAGVVGTIATHIQAPADLLADEYVFVLHEAVDDADETPRACSAFSPAAPE